MGMALDIWNSIDVELGPGGVEVIGEGADRLPEDRRNLVHRSFRLPFEASGQIVPEVAITSRNQVPLARGLGSSSAAVVGGLLAGNEMAGQPMSSEQLLELAAETEGHPDNAAPALLGGCQIVVRHKGSLVTSRVPLPQDLNTVLFIPDTRMPTQQARDILPSSVPRRAAVYNIGRVALLVKALATDDLSDLAVATDDMLHQRQRQAIFPAMKSIIQGALDAGALGAFLSGAGPTVLALTKGREMTIGYEMSDAAEKSGVSGTVKVTSPTEMGAHVVEGS
jgi:homoserine kinase